MAPSPAILEGTDHRPWPLPDAPWDLAMRWHDLLFMHWPVEQEHLRRHIPPGLAIDTFEHRAWIGVVPFRMSHVHPRTLPALPWISAFPELNVRTYVTAGGKPGVWFFSLDAARRLAVCIARWRFHLPYFHARMSCEIEGEWIRHESRRLRPAAPETALRLRYRPTAGIATARPGTIDHWLTERYCLYSADSRERVWRGEVHHQPWPLQPAEARIEHLTMTDWLGIPLPGPPPLLHFARFLDVVAWNIRPA